MKMRMLNQDGSRLFSPLKIVAALVMLGLGLVASALLIFLVYMSVSQTIIQVYAPAPLTYDKLSYSPAQRDVCPGIDPRTGIVETLNFTVTQTVQAPGRLDVLRSFWNRSLRRAAREPDGSTPVIHDLLVTPFENVGDTRVIPLSIRLPDLPPGSYLMPTSVRGVNTNEAQYEVAFVVPEGCGPWVPLPTQ